MDVPKFVEFVHADEHLSSIEAGMFFLEHTRVVEQRSEITAWDVFLSWFSMRRKAY